MSNNKNHKRKMNRCVATGKVINGRDAIIADKKVIIEYLKKHGYKITAPMHEIVAYSAWITSLIIISIALLITPLATAQNYTGINNFLTIDFTQNISIALFYLLFAVAGFLAFMRLFLFAGSIIIIASLIMIFSGINALLSLLFMVVGIVLIGYET